jgi:hypothetical protein
MMALQSLTKVPFRCVDEINQGMDEVNERYSRLSLLLSIHLSVFYFVCLSVLLSVRLFF